MNTHRLDAKENESGFFLLAGPGRRVTSGFISTSTLPVAAVESPGPDSRKSFTARVLFPLPPVPV